jgi:phage regulator Rha-like protein
MEEAKIWWTEVRGGSLRSQIVTLKRGQHIKYRPYAFTEHGILMLSSVLNSKRAIKVNIEIMRTFVRLRRILASNKELAKRLDELEKKYDAQFKIVFDAIRKLMTPPEAQTPKKRIGFLVEEPQVPYESLRGYKKQKKR